MKAALCSTVLALVAILTVQVDGLKCYNCASDRRLAGRDLLYSADCKSNWEKAPTIDKACPNCACSIYLMEDGKLKFQQLKMLLNVFSIFVENKTSYTVRTWDVAMQQTEQLGRLTKIQQKQLMSLTASWCNTDLCNSAPTAFKGSNSSLLHHLTGTWFYLCTSTFPGLAAAAMLLITLFVIG